MKTEICRICKNMNITEFNSKNIFVDENTEIIKKLKLCANILIEIEDQLPHFICEDCEKELNIAFNFRLKCEQVDAELRELCQLEQLLSLENETAEYVTKTNFDDIHYKKEVIVEDNFIEFDILNEVADIKFQDKIIDVKNFKNHTESSIKSENINNDVSEDMISNIESASEDDMFSNKANDPLITKENEESTHKENLQVEFKVIGRYICETCQFATDRYINYCLHIKTHGNKRFQCQICSNWFKTKCKLKAHIKDSHNKELNFSTCGQCGKILSNVRNLQRHISNQHCTLRPHKCTICQQCFSRSDNLREHTLTVHSDVRNYFCEVENCKGQFKSKKRLTNHKLQIHNLTNKGTIQINRKLKCPQCNKLFNSNSILKTHLRWHNGEKPYLCNDCGKRFSFQSSLYVHSLIHKNIKPYKCNICDVSFRQHHHLKSHKAVHNRGKNYKCDLCSKAFTSKGNLTEHMKIHLGMPRKRSRRNKITKHNNTGVRK